MCPRDTTSEFLIRAETLQGEPAVLAFGEHDSLQENRKYHRKAPDKVT